MANARESADARSDLLTIVAIAVVAYALANLAHEGLGHGGTCLLTGGRPQVLSSVHFECEDVSSAGAKWVAAAGTLVNLALGLLSVAALRSARGGHARFFFWLFASLNLFQGAGYWLFSGIGNIGDWAQVIDGLSFPIAWRIGLALVGAITYMAAARSAAVMIAPLVGSDGRIARARRLAVPSYLAGGLLYCVSGLFNPIGPVLIFISAAAASFGGGSGFLWFHEWLKSPRVPLSGEAPAVIDRRTGWIAAGAITSLVFVVILGRGIRF